MTPRPAKYSVRNVGKNDPWAYGRPGGESESPTEHRQDAEINTNLHRVLPSTSRRGRVGTGPYTAPSRWPNYFWNALFASAQMVFLKSSMLNWPLRTAVTLSPMMRSYSGQLPAHSGPSAVGLFLSAMPFKKA